MSITWPIGCPKIKGPYTSTNIYTEIFLKTSPIDKAGINLLVGNSSRIGLLTSTKEKYNLATGLIDNPTLNLDSAVISFSAGMQSLIALQTDSFAQSALLPDDYFNINLDPFNQFALPSNILVNMLGYGNKNNITSIDDINPGLDLVGVWPHQQDISPIGSIIDGLTQTVKNYRASVSLTNVAQQISEWRWLHPNRPRCINPKTVLLKSQLNASNLSNVSLYPQGINKWEIFRQDFFSSDMKSNTLITDDINFPMSNDVFDFSYNYLAAPGCLLITVKKAFLYDDGTGSTAKGLNTSRFNIDPSLYNFPVMFRIGLEWLEDFSLAMNNCKFIDNTLNGVNPLLADGFDLIKSLSFLHRAYINCKRLYVWRICNDIMKYRITTTTGIVSLIKQGKIPGVYMCLLEGKADYSNVNINDSIIPQPLWDNMILRSGNNLAALTTVELSAYLSASLVNEGVPSNKYGTIKIIVDNNGIPLQSFNSSNTINSISLEDCHSNTLCFVPFRPPIIIKGVTPTPARGTSSGNIILYIIMVIVIILIIILLIYFYMKKPPKQEVVIAPLTTISKFTTKRLSDSI